MQLDQNLDQVEFEGDTLRIRIRRAHPHMPNSFLEIDAPGAFAEYVYRFEMHPKIALAEIVVAGGAAEPKTVVAGTGFRP
ncbi:MAG: hypothetical protein ING19_14025 [Azospirillum sp.]|nr:hypothetical protein [Azospirillum sp.]